MAHFGNKEPIQEYVTLSSFLGHKHKILVQSEHFSSLQHEVHMVSYCDRLMGLDGRRPFSVVLRQQFAVNSFSSEAASAIFIKLHRNVYCIVL